MTATLLFDTIVETQRVITLSKCPNGRVEILLAEDYEPWRNRVREILQARPEWEIVCEFGAGMQAVKKSQKFMPDVVLLDIGMPVLNGIQAAEQIRHKSADCRILFLTQHDDEEIRAAALKAGADGYVLKSEAASGLIHAINTALLVGNP